MLKVNTDQKRDYLNDIFFHSWMYKNKLIEYANDKEEERRNTPEFKQGSEIRKKIQLSKLKEVDEITEEILAQHKLESSEEIVVFTKDEEKKLEKQAKDLFKESFVKVDNYPSGRPLIKSIQAAYEYRLEHKKIIMTTSCVYIMQDIVIGMKKIRENRGKGGKHRSLKFKAFRHFNTVPLGKLGGKQEETTEQLKGLVIGMKSNKMFFQFRHFNQSKEKLKHVFDSNNEIRTHTLVRKPKADGKTYNYFIQFVCTGTPLNEVMVRPSGKVTIDIGVYNIGFINEKNEMELIEYPQPNEIKQEEIIQIQQEMDYLLRKNNPQNYNEDGTIKERNKRSAWHFSNKYQRLRGRLAILNRQIATTRKITNNTIANYMMQFGKEFYVEDHDFSEWSVKKKLEDVIKKDGTYGSRSRYGSEIGTFAPAQIIQAINEKLAYLDLEPIHKVNTIESKISQYRHDTGKYISNDLSEKEVMIDDQSYIKRLYRAFIMQHLDTESHTFNTNSITQAWKSFQLAYKEYIATHN